MRISLFAGVAMVCVGASAFAQQPPAFPMRSQNPAQMSIDNAMCYSYANQHTGVNMAKVSQAPIKPQAAKPGAVKQVAVAAPLPSAMASGASAPYPASASGKASAPSASASAPVTASAPVIASGSGSASAARPGVASDARAVANASSSSTDAPMPALPPPEPPMVQYWRAYSECMTDRGYMVK